MQKLTQQQLESDLFISQNAFSCILRSIEEPLEALIILGDFGLDILPADLVWVILKKQKQKLKPTSF